MGKKDTITIDYVRQPNVFADAFNYLIYGGKKVIDPGTLVELDTRELGVPFGSRGKGHPVQRVRDVIKAATIKTDRTTVYLLLAVENQATVHYAMPVREMLYDALQYAKQIEQLTSEHKKAGDFAGRGREAYLSGILPEDRLVPVVSLVIHFGSGKWDGPRSLHEMFGDYPKEVLALVPDYKINIISPEDISDEDFTKFSSGLQEVLSFIKYTDDDDQLTNLVTKNPRFSHLGRKEVEVLNACAHAGIDLTNDQQEVFDMRTVMQRLADHAEQRAEQRAEQKKNEEVAKEVAKIKADLERERAKERADLEREHAKEKADFEMALIQTARGIMSALNCSADAALKIMQLSHENAEKVRKELQ